MHIPETCGNIGSKTIFCADIAKKYTNCDDQFISVASIQLGYYKIKAAFMTICKIMDITIFQSSKKRYGWEYGKAFKEEQLVGQT